MSDDQRYPRCVILARDATSSRVLHGGLGSFGCGTMWTDAEGYIDPAVLAAAPVDPERPDDLGYTATRTQAIVHAEWLTTQEETT